MPRYVPRVFGGTIIIEDAGQNAQGYGGTWRRNGNRGRSRASGTILPTRIDNSGDHTPLYDIPRSETGHVTGL
jgi:hypothetical protein